MAAATNLKSDAVYWWLTLVDSGSELNGFIGTERVFVHGCSRGG